MPDVPKILQLATRALNENALCCFLLGSQIFY